MRLVVLIPDGAADRPVEKLSGRTPLEAAATPSMDALAHGGELGLATFTPSRKPPGSDVAAMSLLGYDPMKFHTGRAPLEAVSMGVELGAREVAFRANLVTLAGDVLTDYSAGHIRTDQARALVGSLDEALGARFGVRFGGGVSYRHLMVMPDLSCLKARTTPPHDITGRPYAKYLPRGRGGRQLREIMSAAGRVLAAHDVNRVRVDLGENPASALWLWGQGTRTSMPSFRERYGRSGAMISAVDLLRSLGLLLGFEIVDVPGATGNTDTNYVGKGLAAVDAANRADVVVVHVEAPDEAAHGGGLLEKIKCIEAVERHVVAPVLDFARAAGDVRVLLAPDHPTPVELRTHEHGAVPFALWGPGVEPNGGACFGERAAEAAGLAFRRGHTLMPHALGLDATGAGA